MVDADGVVIWLGGAREDLVRGTVAYVRVELVNISSLIPSRSR